MRNPNFGCSRRIWFAMALLSFSLAGLVWAEGTRIGMEGWLFSPDKVTIKSGDTITWHNNDDTTHDLTFEEGIEGRPTVDEPHRLRQKQELSLTFTKPGTYQYYCKTHLDFDMKGVVIVE